MPPAPIRASSRPDQINGDIHVMSLDGQQQRPVQETPELEMIPGWFPAGRLA